MGNIKDEHPKVGEFCEENPNSLDIRYFLPSEWIRQETWTGAESILLLSGIEPSPAADFLFPPYGTGGGTWLELSTHQSSPSNPIELLIKKGNKTIAKDVVLLAYKEADIRLNYFLSAWRRRVDVSISTRSKPFDMKHSVVDVLKWVADRRYTKYVPWWENAVKYGLIDEQGNILNAFPDEDYMFKSLDATPPPPEEAPIPEKRENNLLNIIGVLLEVTTGKHKKDKFPSEQALKDFIGTEYPKGGLSERYLSDVFRDAKKVLKDRAK